MVKINSKYSFCFKKISWIKSTSVCFVGIQLWNMKKDLRHLVVSAVLKSIFIFWSWIPKNKILCIHVKNHGIRKSWNCINKNNNAIVKLNMKLTKKSLGYQIGGALRQKSRMAHISTMGPCLIIAITILENDYTIQRFWACKKTFKQNFSDTFTFSCIYNYILCIQ